MKTIITIGRQFGSGGKEIGIRVARSWAFPSMTRSCCGGRQEERPVREDF